MKTKIIYISGNELFNMADIRAAFEEVRGTLNLGADTVLFGVPVDNDDALAGDATATSTSVVDDAENIPGPIESAESHVTAEICQTIPDETVNAPESTELPPVSVQKKPRARRKTAAVPDTDNTDTLQHDSQSTDNTTSTDEKIIPILSVLATKQDNDIAPESKTEPESPETGADDVSVVADIDISAQLAAPTDDDAVVETTTIADMINDDAPSEPVEKTLEQLLESMAPLREDVTPDTPDHDVISDDAEIDDSAQITDAPDATLEQLAAEFAQTQDKIPDEQKSESHSKIGKLKNILPFKKVKRDDGGIMGDLFGWAGIAANDDDFSIPGFFTNAASKK